MQIKSELLLASLNSDTGDILYTFKWVYPRIILPEILTHRVLSRNTASTRAIPTKRQVAAVWGDPFVPSYIGANQKGMQAGDELTGWRRLAASFVWKVSRLPAIAASLTLDALGAHKQVCGRLVEPWSWTTQLVSATDLDGLFAQRCHESTEPHFQEVAKQAREQVQHAAYNLQEMRRSNKAAWVRFDGHTVYQVLQVGEWHMPFVALPEETPTLEPDAYADGSPRQLTLQGWKKVSAARCARVSYNMPDSGKPSSVEQDLKLFARLAEAKPAHLSPLEHVAQAMDKSDTWVQRAESNFTGWKQFREEYE